MRKLMLVLMIVACFGMIGCGPKLMRIVEPALVDETVAPDEAIIVFFRPSSFVGGGLNPGLIEVDENEKLNFVAILSNGTKYLHRTTPGKHLYFWSSASMFGGLVSYILEANLEAGKIYYTSMFAVNSFTPVVDVSDGSFREDLASCDWVENTPEGQVWFDNNITSLQNKYIQAHIIQKLEMPKARVGSTEIDMIIKPEYGTFTPVR